MSTTPLNIDYRADGGVVVTMPSPGNRLVVGLGLGLGIPYLAIVVIGTVIAWVIAPPDLRREVILGSIIIHLFMAAIHALAASSVWLAFYNLHGSEIVEVSPDLVVIRRRALHFTVPIKLGRRGPGSITPLDPSLHPGKWPHPRLEVRSGRSAARFGAGLSAAEADVVCTAVAAALEGTGA